MTEIQKVILDIFKEVSSLCEQHGIPYYAIGGTCIGAIRHNGFIPWDDDLDIAVPIESFEKLKRVLRDNLPPKYQLYDCNGVTHYHYIFMKVHNVETTYINNKSKQYKDSYTGIYMDIMPLGGIPDSRLGKTFFINRIKIFYALNYLRRFPLCIQKSVRGKILSLLFKPPLAAFRYNYFSDKYLELLQKHPFDSSKLTGYVWQPAKISKLIFPKEWFQSTKKVKFEDTVICCPNDYRSYLSAHFGDYMKLPPEKDRIEVHPSYLDFEHSYTEYQNGTRIITLKKKE